MRVAIDVSPLAQTRAGTARYLKGLMRELERRDDVAVSTRSFGGKSRLSTLARDGIWYPFLLGRERAADVLHFQRTAVLCARAFRSSSPCTTSPCSAIRRRSTVGLGRTVRAWPRSSFARRSG